MTYILIFLLLVLSFRVILKWAMPFITKWMLKKVQTKMQGAFDASTQNQSEDNYSQTSNTKTPKVKKQVGEYIDFEEVE